MVNSNIRIRIRSSNWNLMYHPAICLGVWLWETGRAVCYFTSWVSAGSPFPPLGSKAMGPKVSQRHFVLMVGSMRTVVREVQYLLRPHRWSQAYPLRAYEPGSMPNAQGHHQGVATSLPVCHTLPKSLTKSFRMPVWCSACECGALYHPPHHQPPCL